MGEKNVVLVWNPKSGDSDSGQERERNQVEIAAMKCIFFEFMSICKLEILYTRHSGGGLHPAGAQPSGTGENKKLYQAIFETKNHLIFGQGGVKNEF